MNTSAVLPKGVSLDHLLTQLRFLSWGAADILIAYARGDIPPYGFSPVLEVENASVDPVSAADLAVNSWFLDGFKNKYEFVNWEILSEEMTKGDMENNYLSASDWLWILDPLDGTKDFLAGTGEYAVQLALVYKNRPVLGLLLLPEVEELWFGVIGHETWCENRKGEKKSSNLSKRDPLFEGILIASRNHRDNNLEELIKRLPIKESKVVGSVGCKIAKILRGEADLYISLSGATSPKDWDMASPEAVLLAAGGSFTHADGENLLYNNGDLLQSGCLVATNGKNHSEICRIILKEINLIDPEFIA